MRYSILLLPLSLLTACGDPPATDQASEVTDRTPVTVTHITNGPLHETVQLSASSAYLIKSPVRANITGYISEVHCAPGQRVGKGDLLFTLRTKESQSIGSAIQKLDSSFHFTGTLPVRASATGTLGPVDHVNGDYVQDGDVLATISDRSSFVFILSVPYELRGLLAANAQVKLTLPDGSRMQGMQGARLPLVDPTAQALQVPVHVSLTEDLPEGLTATAELDRSENKSTSYLPNEAILTDDTQEHYWVVRMANDSTAVKVPVTIGTHTKSATEIVAPVLGATDRILLTGNYGLPDSALVRIIGQ